MICGIRTLILCAILIGAIASIAPNAAGALNDRTFAAVAASEPAIGDIVFIRIPGPLFARVADTTQSWASHVGIIVDYRNGDWVVAESGVPFVRETPLRKFLGRSQGLKFSICRLRTAPTEAQKRAMRRFADAQIGRRYSLGFDLESKTTTFCSKFVHDIVYESTREPIGEIETFDHLLHRNPNAPLGFWRVWFLGSIPWQRTTITPASELNSPLLRVVIKNNV